MLYFILSSFPGECLPLNSTASMEINRSFTEKHVRMAQNHHIATFDAVGTQFYVGFDFVPSKLQTNWASVFHMSNADDCCKNGERIPAVWFRRENEISYVYIASGEYTLTLSVSVARRA